MSKGPNNPVSNAAGGYNTIAASQTAQILSATSGGTTGATGDYLQALIIIPATAAGGVVTLLDGATSIPIYVGGGTTALTGLLPQRTEFGIQSIAGPWKITTGANISVIALGAFS